MNIEWILENRFFKKAILFLAVLDVILWFLIFNSNKLSNLELYFLDVGQGDSSLALLPGGVKVLMDGGPANGKLHKNIESILPIQDRYIDVVVMTHPQQDHYGGFLELFRNYKIGIFITSGYDSENVSWKELNKIILDQHILTAVLNSGDSISYKDARFKILSPKPKEKVKDINDASLVILLEGGGAKALFTGDISAKKERFLTERFGLDADILKVSHHGSKYSSDQMFLQEVSPAVSVIEVGKNSYGHPTAQVLSGLASVRSQVYRTDLDGLVKIRINNGKMEIFKSN